MKRNNNKSDGYLDSPLSGCPELIPFDTRVPEATESAGSSRSTEGHPKLEI